ncbi:hypothetical protein Hanom_Chr16g01504181 [Helianthus anomalus]
MNEWLYLHINELPKPPNPFIMSPLLLLIDFCQPSLYRMVTYIMLEEALILLLSVQRKPASVNRLLGCEI